MESQISPVKPKKAVEIVPKHIPVRNERAMPQHVIADAQKAARSLKEVAAHGY